MMGSFWLALLAVVGAVLLMFFVWWLGAWVDRFLPWPARKEVKKKEEK